MPCLGNVLTRLLCLHRPLLGVQFKRSCLHGYVLAILLSVPCVIKSLHSLYPVYPFLFTCHVLAMFLTIPCVYTTPLPYPSLLQMFVRKKLTLIPLRISYTTLHQLTCNTPHVSLSRVTNFSTYLYHLSVRFVCISQRVFSLIIFLVIYILSNKVSTPTASPATKWSVATEKLKPINYD